MLISGLQSSNSLLDSLASTSQSTSSTSNQNSFDTALSNLISAIQSGDTTSAEKYLAQVQQLTPANADSNSPLGQFISSVSSALDSNDISAAQTALTTLESQPAPSNVQGPPPPSDSSSSTTSEYIQDIVSLFSAISSGDLSGAQSAYDSLTSLMQSNAASSTTSSTDTSTSSSSSTSDGAALASLLQQIGTALSSGDISSAQTSLDSFLKSLSTGSLVSASA